MTQREIIASLPLHLRRFARVQDYARYTARDHAVWRYLLRQLTPRLSGSAHPRYLEGLAATGIGLERIPSIDAMNACLGKIGWRAVVVDGFIPPAVFMELQALKVLAIALAMRSIDHILYTPAPDIVHESAGHAPFIVDPDYAEFLQRFGEVGMKAIATRRDHALYAAIRQLSIVKAAPGASAAAISAAERDLARLQAAGEPPSEAALLARLHWWTVEYGLVGCVDDYKIFGAGLLSSLGESEHCLDDRKVNKLPLTVDAVNWSYDITTEQPQLFVAGSCKHLSQVLEAFAARMCFRRGGAESLQVAIDSEAVCSAEYATGLQLSGRFDRLLTDAVGNAIYLGTVGPTQLAYRNRQLPGHGSADHPAGFGSPIGAVKELPRCLSACSGDELGALGIQPGQRVDLAFVSGIHVRGLLTHILRRDRQNLLFSFADCSVADPHGRPLFEPAQGRYELGGGARVVSVFGGAAARAAFDADQEPHDPTVGEQLGEPDAHAQSNDHEQRLFELYQRVRNLREHGAADADALAACHAALQRDYPAEWLLRLELLELLERLDRDASPALRRALIGELRALQTRSPTHRRLIGYGLPAAVLVAGTAA
jgi:phenylalanine-4-hydroxylase